MSTRPQPSAPPESERPAFGPPGPLSATDIQTLHTGLDVVRALGRMEHAVEVLGHTTNSHGEKIQQLIQKTDKTAFAIPVLENAIARHDKDLNQLGRIAHTAKTFGNIALALISGIGIVFLAYLYHRFAPLLFSK